MGCDGGTIPRRDELVRLKKKPEQKDKDAERAYKWRNCALSQQLLQAPIVACGLGRLYSKSSVIEALLDKETKPASIDHIKNLKDIKDLNLTKNPAYVDADRTSGDAHEGSAPFICPISGIEMSGKFRFVFLWSCGCVLAERALKEVKQNLCHMCQQPFTNDDVVIINGTDEDIEQQKEKMAIRVANRKSTKKPKAPKTQPTATVTSSSTEANVDVKTEIKVEPVEGSSGSQQIKTEPEASSSKVKNEMDTIPLALPKYNPNKVVRGPFGSTKRAHSSNLVQDPSYKKTKKDYSVANDPKSSEVLKSIFTSHESEKNQNRAHWVTYNPFYN